MNFSDCIEHTGGVLEYSPDGRFVAISRAFDVMVSNEQLNSNLPAVGIRNRDTETPPEDVVP